MKHERTTVINLASLPPDMHKVLMQLCLVLERHNTTSGFKAITLLSEMLGTSWAQQKDVSMDKTLWLMSLQCRALTETLMVAVDTRPEVPVTPRFERAMAGLADFYEYLLEESGHKAEMEQQNKAQPRPQEHSDHLKQAIAGMTTYGEGTR